MRVGIYAYQLQSAEQRSAISPLDEACRFDDLSKNIMRAHCSLSVGRLTIGEINCFVQEVGYLLLRFLQDLRALALEGRGMPHYVHSAEMIYLR